MQMFPDIRSAYPQADVRTAKESAGEAICVIQKDVSDCPDAERDINTAQFISQTKMESTGGFCRQHNSHSSENHANETHSDNR